MKPNSAIGFIASGLSLWLLRRPPASRRTMLAGRGLAALALLIGVATLFEYGVSRGIGIDEILFSDEPRAMQTWPRGRMAPQSALLFVVIGGGLLLLDVETKRGRQPAQYLAVIGGIIAYLPLLGYAYGVPEFFGIARYTAMALHSSLTFLVLAAGVLFARSDRGIASVLTSDALGGQLARRLLPASVIVPAVLGYVRVSLEFRGLYPTGIGTAALVVAVTVLFGGITWWVSAALTRSDRERRITQERLDEERVRLEAVMEQMPAGVIIADAPSGRLVRANQRVAEIWRMPFIPAASVKEYGSWTGFASDGRPIAPGSWALSRVLASGEAVLNQEVEIVRGDGTRGWILNSAAPVRDRDGRMLGGVATFVDITESKSLEEELRRLKDELEERVRARTAELVAANEELEAFAYSVSHDLRAPLRWVHGFAQALDEEYADRLDEQGMQYLQDIQDSSVHMAALIDGFLQLSRITRAELERQEVDLSELGREVAAELARSDPRPAMELSVANGLRDRGDPRLLRSVLYNLLENAWKFTRTRPVARIEVGAIEVDGGRAYFVRDNGVGFDMESAGKLFQPFERLHRAAEFEGTGIGLALARRIVRRHGGRLWAHAEPEKGATFFFTLSPGELVP